jgi:hypothetical protein
MIICDKCYAEYESDVPEFCPKCGTALWVESETKKCSFSEACGKPALGVIPMVNIGVMGNLGHVYVCREHAKEAEKQGFWVDYDNWRI